MSYRIKTDIISDIIPDLKFSERYNPKKFSRKKIIFQKNNIPYLSVCTFAKFSHTYVCVSRGNIYIYIYIYI